MTALVAVMFAGFQWIDAQAREADYRVLRKRGMVVDAVVTEHVDNPDGSVIAATDTWSARVRLPDCSTVHLDTFGYRLAVGAHVVATVDPRHRVAARLSSPSGTPGSHMDDPPARRVIAIALMALSGLAAATLVTLEFTEAARPHRRRASGAAAALSGPKRRASGGGPAAGGCRCLRESGALTATAARLRSCSTLWLVVRVGVTVSECQGRA
ncbi:hypothetical protein K7B10_38845 [Streptomyces flavotricini]|uniref:DUF3592 domain-containing protein n=1 Tax=Streptomyces flavotricini TaxID=66888 RepID=A0ABS8EIE4_9ACTN|nr:hypothetical protein [Streptomyces flavotricini]MCC0100618.1 hypothetical protein [Streptomyces flavotricini]